MVHKQVLKALKKKQAISTTTVLLCTHSFSLFRLGVSLSTIGGNGDEEASELYKMRYNKNYEDL